MDKIEITAEMPTAWVNLFEALTILARHQNNESSPLHCEHDTLYVMADPRKFTTAELLRLDELGFFSSGEGECFQSFEFGRA